MYFIGYDIGSSSIKAALVDAQSGIAISQAQFPENEMSIDSAQPSWAEQSPEIWWNNLIQANQKLLSQVDIDQSQITSIGIAYQMHGLVVIDENHEVLRPSIIWCDSRAVDIGEQAFHDLGHEFCLSHLLNSPDNFTASKLSWVQKNEPEIYDRIHKVMLPGDFIAMNLTGEINTTIPGLSEGMFWDYHNHDLSIELLDYYFINKDLIPAIVPSFGVQGQLTVAASELLGLRPGIPLTYRAGDQPNNAMSLSVTEPNQVAATGGTSGVIYGVQDNYNYDSLSRVNGFAHVNHDKSSIRIGQLLCINGAGIQYAWIKNLLGHSINYNQMEDLAGKISIGSEGLQIFPFGNGAERMFLNKDVGAHINNLRFSDHNQSHIIRATLEGIAFAFAYGFEVLKNLGLDPTVIRVGNDNLFRSPIFSRTISNLIQCPIHVMKTTGAIGAAKASGIATGFYSDIQDAFSNLSIDRCYEPSGEQNIYEGHYLNWKKTLDLILSNK